MSWLSLLWILHRTIFLSDCHWEIQLPYRCLITDKTVDSGFCLHCGELAASTFVAFASDLRVTFERKLDLLEHLLSSRWWPVIVRKERLVA